MKGAAASRAVVTAVCLVSFALLAPGGALPPAPERAAAATLPPGFQESVVISGLTHPTVVRFSPDGRVFVAEKSGLIKVFDSLSDPTPTVYADLRTNTFNSWDRGLLGMALHPSFPTIQDVYALYTYDHELGSTSPPPRWGTPGSSSDECPTPPGPTEDGCLVSGRLSVLREAALLPYRDTVLADTPAAYWRLGEASGTTAADASGNGRAGTYVASPSLGQPGALAGDTNTAVGFNGSSQYVNTPYAAGLNAPAFTVEAWAYVTGGQGSWRSVVTSRDSSATFQRGYVIYAGSDNFWQFWVGSGSGGWSSVYGPPVTLNKWTHLVGTFSGTTARFYVDGQPAAEASTTYAVNTARPLRVAAGSTETPPNFFFPGRVDEVAVYGAALPADRVQAHYNSGTGGQGVRVETVLVEDWCQQYPSHSIGTVEFGPDGMLYVSGGDGASYDFADYGQDGSPLNPCGDPPGGVGSTLTPPTAEGGALRSQDLRTTSDPTTLDGTVIRVNPLTGAAPPDNPLAGSANANARRIIAYGLRNPFRFTFRPGTSEIWLGDVGWGEWEEINRILNPTDATVENFGWPCYEGNSRQQGYDAADLSICEGLYTANIDTKPYHAYHHFGPVVPGESCPQGTSAISGLAFEFAPTGSTFPADYQGALFFADYARGCIWVMKKDGSGPPTPGRLEVFAADAATPAQLEFGPDGNLYYVDIIGGTIRRISFTAAPPPTCTTGQYLAEYFANPTLSGTATFSRCETAIDYDWGSSGPGNGVPADGFSARWTGNFNFPAGDTTFSATTNDGMRLWIDGSLVIDKWFDQGTTTYTATRTLTAGVHQVKVEYYANTGAAVARVAWAGANAAPTPTITTPTAATTWKVGDTIGFSGSATDPEDGALPASALSWSLVLQHCPSGCHSHPLQTFTGVASGSFVAPDHEYPSHLVLQLTATDSDDSSASTTVQLNPITTTLTFASSPAGLQLVVNSASATAPFTRTVIVGSANSISAPSPQTLGGTTYTFQRWSDGGAQTHNIVAPATATPYTAEYTSAGATPPANTALPSISGQPREGETLTAANGTWTGSTPMAFSYQWLRCASSSSPCDPTGGTASSYVPTAADVGFRLRVAVTATNSAGSATATSNTTAAIKRAR